MSAPLIIPFNFQPTSTSVGSSSYTVPSGKYALVKLSNAIYPVLNSVPMCYSYSAGSVSGTVTPNFLSFASNIGFHKYTWSSASNTGSVNWINIILPTGTLSFPPARTGAGSYTARAIDEIPSLGASSSTSPWITTVSGIVVYYGVFNEVWLKSGDVLTFTGAIIYSEYNVIS
jgi:hypothetical protein